LAIAAETWGTDILRERSYLWLLASRLLILMGGASVLNFILVAYLPDALRLPKEDQGTIFTIMLAIASVISLVAIVPAARLSDRIGRKPVIYGCTAIGAIGVFLIAIAPGIPLAVVGAALFGASQGTFLAVDWALMTDIIPRASSGRYMGLSNVVTASSTTLAVIIGGFVLDFVNAGFGRGSGVRVEYLFGVAYFVLGALLLRPVVEPERRGGRTAEAAATS
jgi:MFS family permease